MKAVGIRELKNRLSEYVRLVRAGEEFLVTDRGEIVAELRPPLRAESMLEPYPGLARLARQGRVRLGSENSPDLYPPLAGRTEKGAAARLLDDERGER